MTFGEKIQKLRREAGLSQESFAEQLGVSRQAVSKWETDRGYPETEKMIRISKLFHVTLTIFWMMKTPRRRGWRKIPEG